MAAGDPPLTADPQDVPPLTSEQLAQIQGTPLGVRPATDLDAPLYGGYFGHRLYLNMNPPPLDSVQAAQDAREIAAQRMIRAARPGARAAPPPMPEGEDHKEWADYYDALARHHTPPEWNDDLEAAARASHPYRDQLERSVAMGVMSPEVAERYRAGDVAGAIREHLTPSYMRDVPSSPEATAALADPNARPGKIGPPSGPPTAAQVVTGLGTDVAANLAPELKVGAPMLAAVGGGIKRAAGEAAAEAAPKVLFDRTKVGSGTPLYGDRVVIDVDPRALIAAHQATDPGMAEYKKVGRVANFVAKGNTLAMPEVSSVGDDLRFVNGRNRAKFAADQGLPSIPIAVEGHALPVVQELLAKHAQPPPETLPSLPATATAAITAAPKGKGGYLAEARDQPLGSHPLERALSATPILEADAAYAPRSRGVPDIAQELNDRGSAALKNMGIRSGKIAVADSTPATDEIISRTLAGEIKAALARQGNSGTWYTQKIREAVAVASLLHPEIATDPNARFAFTAGLAITSQGERVVNNVRLGEPAYAYFKEHGRFPTDIKAQNAKAMNKNFERLNDLISKGEDLARQARRNDITGAGLDFAREFLDQEFTVRDLKKLGYKIGGENQDTKVRGSAILGPKIGGGFYQNLNGNYDPVTMDLWFMRAWGRLTGTLKDTVTEEGLAKQRTRLEDALREAGRKVPARADGLERAATDISTAHERDFAANRALYDSGERTKSELVHAAQRYLHGIAGVRQSPRSGNERNWMRDRVNAARQMLAKEGINVTNADLQAIWWYPEKELYAKMGGTDSDILNADYAGAFRDLVRNRGISDEQIERAIRAASGRP